MKPSNARTRTGVAMTFFVILFISASAMAQQQPKEEQPDAWAQYQTEMQIKCKVLAEDVSKIKYKATDKEIQSQGLMSAYTKFYDEETQFQALLFKMDGIISENTRAAFKEKLTAEYSQLETAADAVLREYQNALNETKR